jgi:fibronectin-binding autotransporter adhesin
MKSRIQLATSPLVASILAFAAVGRAADGTWINIENSVSGAGANWGEASNWNASSIADGVDGVASFIYGPTRSINNAAQDIGSTIFLEANRTIGHIIMEDIDELNSDSVSVASPSTAGGFSANVTTNVLTLDTSVGTPTVLVGQNLNSVGGKKGIIAVLVAGNDGLRKTGPGFLALRIPAAGQVHSFTGNFLIDGGYVELSSATAYTGNTAVRGGSFLGLNFSNANAPVTNLINPASPLVLGSDGTDGGVRGSGVVWNNNKAATTSSAQTWASTTLNEGTHEIRAVTNTNINQAYTLGAITRNAGATLNFSKPTAAGTGTFASTITNGAGGIIGPWATYQSSTGLDWASGSGSAVTPVAAASYTANAWASGNNTNAVVSQALSGAITGTLRFNQGYVPNLVLSGVNAVSTGGIISAIQGASFTGSGSLTSGSAELLLHSYGGGSNGARFEADIADNGAGPVKVIKAGPGNLTYLKDMSYTGGTYVGGGNLIIGGGYGGGTVGGVTGDIFVNSLSLANGAFNPSGFVAVNRAGTYTLTNNVNGPGGIAQYSTGTLVLGKQFNVRTLQALTGTTRLDFSAAGAPATQIINSMETVPGSAPLATANLVLRNSVLELVGSAGVTNVQSFGVTQTSGSSRISLQPGAGGTLSVNLGALGRFVGSADGGGTIRLDLPAGATAKAPATQTYAGVSAANSIIYDLQTAYVTVNDNEWAARDATISNIVPGSAIPGFYTLSSGGSLAGNLDVDNSPTVSTSTSLGSLRFNTAGANTLTIGAGAVLDPKGILVTPAVGAADITIAGAGSLRASTGNGRRDLVIFQNNTAGNLIISSAIGQVDATNRTALAKSGLGTLVLADNAGAAVTHTMTDRIFVNEGTLRLGNNVNIGTSAARLDSVFARNGTLEMEGNSTIFANAFTSIGQRQGENGTMSMKGSAIFDSNADFNVGDVAAKGTLTLDNNAKIITKSFYVGKVGYTEGYTTLKGSSVITAGNTPANDWHLGGTNGSDGMAYGKLTIQDNALFDAGNQNWQVGRNGIGVVDQTGGTFQGTGFNVIGRFHTSAGTWNVSGGTLNTLTTSAAGVTPAAKEYLIVGEEGTGTLNVSGTGLVRARSLSLGHNGGFGTLTVSGNGVVDLTTGPVPANTQAGVAFGAGVAGTPALSVPGGARGVVQLDGGVLKTTSIIERTGSVVNSRVNFNGGLVQAVATNANFMFNLDTAAVQAGGAKLDSNGVNITVAQPLIHDLAAPAVDGGLTKLGLGVLTLNSAANSNTYTGPTAVQAGSILLGASNQLPDSAALTLSAGTTISAANNQDVTGALNLLGNAILDMGAATGASITFSGAGSWTGVLSIWNYSGARWTPGADKLLFTDTSAVSLSGVQFYSDNGITVLGTGGGGFIGNELVPVPEASNVLFGLALLGAAGWREGRRSRR